MWCFSWILGIGLACAFAILNAMWFEMREDRMAETARPASREPGERERFKA